MPIAQSRMIALIDIIDETLATRERLCQLARAELDEALSTFYATPEDDRCAAAGNILAHLQCLATALLDSPRGLSAASIELLAKEREHFRIARGPNAVAARSMARRRLRNATEQHAP